MHTRRKLEGGVHLGHIRKDERKILKCILKRVSGCGIDSSGSGKIPMSAYVNIRIGLRHGIVKSISGFKEGF
jgi:hypothetical protein